MIDLDKKQLIACNNRLAVSLYHQVRQVQPDSDNIFFSPYSIINALAMTYAGARGQTAAEFEQALHFQDIEETVHADFSWLRRELEALCAAGGIRFDVANSLWPQYGFALYPSFIGLLRDQYAVEVTSVDYRHPESARMTINNWVEEKTAEKISDMIPPDTFDDKTRLTLINACYFDGKWSSPFDPYNSRKSRFWVSDNTSNDVKMMYQQSRFSYRDHRDFQIVELPYGQSQSDMLSMVLILPREKDGLSALEEKLSAEALTMWTDSLHRQWEVQTSIPKLEFSSSLSLNDMLKSMGMETMFVWQEADFSGITGDEALYVSDALHKAFIKVDEAGTEAAAATAVVLAGYSMSVQHDVRIFKADHPFLFLIRERKHGTILFIGRCTNPSA